MDLVPARLYDGRRSAATTVALGWNDRELIAAPPAGEELRVPLAEIEIVGDVGGDRIVRLPGGASLHVADRDAVAALEQRLGHNRVERWAGRLEGSWRWALAALAGTAATVLLLVFVGLPWAAEQVALRTSPAVAEALGRRTLATLDRAYLRPSRLPDARRAQLAELLDAAAASAPGSPFDYRLELRRGASIGANALALPSGHIVLTDELVELLGDDEQILAVMLHEVGHVEGRHGLRSVYRSAGTLFVLSLLTGDIASLDGAAASLPVFLVDSRYSRAFEREADDYAADRLEALGHGPEPLRAALASLAGARGEDGEPPAFLSSHPPTEERLERLER